MSDPTNDEIAISQVVVTRNDGTFDVMVKGLTTETALFEQLELSKLGSNVASSETDELSTIEVVVSKADEPVLLKMDVVQLTPCEKIQQELAPSDRPVSSMEEDAAAATAAKEEGSGLGIKPDSIRTFLKTHSREQLIERLRKLNYSDFEWVFHYMADNVDFIREPENADLQAIVRSRAVIAGADKPRFARTMTQPGSLAVIGYVVVPMFSRVFDSVFISPTGDVMAEPAEYEILEDLNSPVIHPREAIRSSAGKNELDMSNVFWSPGTGVNFRVDIYSGEVEWNPVPTAPFFPVFATYQVAARVAAYYPVEIHTVDGRIYDKEVDGANGYTGHVVVSDAETARYFNRAWLSSSTDLAPPAGGKLAANHPVVLSGQWREVACYYVVSSDTFIFNGEKYILRTI